MGTWNFVYEVTRCILDGTVKKYIYIGGNDEISIHELFARDDKILFL